MSSERLKPVDKIKGFFRSTRSTSTSKSRVPEVATDNQVGTRPHSGTDSEGMASSAPTTIAAPASNLTDIATSGSDENGSHVQVVPPDTSTSDHEISGFEESSKNPIPHAPQEVDIWKHAYQELGKKNPSLVEHYEQILAREEADEVDSSTQGQATRPGITHSITQLTNLASTKLAKLDDSRLKIHVRSKTFIVKDEVDRVLTIVMAAKDFISSVVSSEPHGALAWAGVCVLLPLLVNPKKQYDDASAGLLEIPLVIRRYQVLEPLYRRRSQENGFLRGDFEKKLTDLYCSILEYQARAVCQWSRNTLHQYGRDVFKADSWTQLFKDIKDQDLACKEIALTLDAGLWEKTVKEESQQLQEMLRSWCEEERRTLKALQEGMEKLQDNAEDQRKQQQSSEQRKEEEACHQSFGPMDYRDHKNQNPSRVSGTCTWFLDNQSFIEWNQQKDSALLWVSADPGCGKSVLLKSVIDEGLLGDDTTLSSVCYFFFKDGYAGQQGLARCISALFHQLFSQKPHLIEYALPDFRRDRRVADNFSSVWDILVQAASDQKAGEVICVLDALDECADKAQETLIKTLKELYSDHRRCRGMKLKFLVSSRPYPIIERRFRTLTKDFPSIHLRGEHESDLISQEINLVIRKRVPELAMELDLSLQAEQRLLGSLLNVPNRTYLWLHLIFEAILKSTGVSSAKAIEKIIGQLPASIDEAYDKILARATDFRLCRRLLHIILGAYEPLTLAQLNVALHMDDHTRAIAELDLEDDEHFEKTVRGLCGLFISVVGSKLFLIHQTAREYLVGQSGNISVWKHSFDLIETDYVLARSCIICLRCAEFEMDPQVRATEYSSNLLGNHCGCDDEDIERPERQLTINVLSLNEHYPFFQYAATNWPGHFSHTEIDKLEELAMTFVTLSLDTSLRGSLFWRIMELLRFFGDIQTQKCFHLW